MTRPSAKQIAREFQKGFVCAVSTMLALHDEPSKAEELLKTLGPIDWRHIDKYDKGILKDAGIVLKRYAGGHAHE